MGNFQLKDKKRIGRRKTSDIGSSASTRHLTRILAYLGENPLASKTEIKLATGLQGCVIEDGLLWLKNHNLIIMRTGNKSMKRYSSK